MSSNGFLKIAGIDGESKDSQHRGWIDIERWDFDASQPGNMANGGGGGAGKVVYSDLTVFTDADKATPALFGYASGGKHIPKIELSVCKAGGNQTEFIRITLEEALVTHCGYSGAASRENVPVIYKFQAARIKHQYWEQTERGGKGAEVQSGWDIKQNKAM